MTHRSTQRDTTRNGRRRSPAVIALVGAVEQEIEHLALAASRGTLDALEPLAIPHGPLLANLHALRSDLVNSTNPSAADPPRPAAVIIPIKLDLAPVHLSRCSAAERIARARVRRIAAMRTLRLPLPGPIGCRPTGDQAIDIPAGSAGHGCGDAASLADTAVTRRPI